jgi:hypothetical protein
MYRIEVGLMGTPSKLYEFLEDNRADARNLAEEIGRQGFWLEESDPPILIPPSQIQLVQVFPTKQPLPKGKKPIRRRPAK